MRRLYFHIGLHKTATTFLQELVFPSLKETTYITRQSVHAAEGWNRLMMADDTLYDPHLVKANTEEWTGDRLLLSSESLSGKPLFFSCGQPFDDRPQVESLFPESSDHFVYPRTGKPNFVSLQPVCQKPR